RVRWSSIFACRKKLLRPVPVVAPKGSWCAEGENIRLRSIRRSGPEYQCDRPPIGSVETRSVFQPLRPRRVFRIARNEAGSLKGRKLATEFTDYTNLIAILQIAAHPGQMDAALDALTLQL